jgi:GTP-binding protein
MSLFAHPEFGRSVHQLQDLPVDRGAEVAFAGRSNAGKSSAINALVHRHKLAFVSKTPGRTQTINFYDLGGERSLVDLPGYGYAAVPQRERSHWGGLISTYLASRQCLRGLVLITDARRPLTALDRQLIDWFAATAKPMHILLTKADKLSRREAGLALKKTESVVCRDRPGLSVQLFSSTSREGVAAARQVVELWLT